MTYSEFRNQYSTIRSFVDAFGALTYEDANALIDAEKICPPAIKACLIDTWYVARRLVKLRYINVSYSDSKDLNIVFNEYDSEFSGNDFEYRYLLDADNTAAFMSMIPHPWEDPNLNIQDWLIENVDCLGRGVDLQGKWIEMGLHGTSVDREDYPGGIHHIATF